MGKRHANTGEYEKRKKDIKLYIWLSGKRKTQMPCSTTMSNSSMREIRQTVKAFREHLRSKNPSTAYYQLRGSILVHAFKPRSKRIECILLTLTVSDRRDCTLVAEDHSKLAVESRVEAQRADAMEHIR
jgi:hypothetical protein